MTPKEKKAFDSLKEDLYNHPEMLMVTVSRKELELIINLLKKESEKTKPV